MKKSVLAVAAVVALPLIVLGTASSVPNVVLDAGGGSAAATTAPPNSFLDDTGTCATSRTSYGISIAEPSNEMRSSARLNAAGAEAITLSKNQRLATTPGVTLRSYLAAVTNPSPAAAAALNGAGVSNRSVWIVEASGFSIEWGGHVGADGKVQPGMTLSHMQDFVDDATGTELFQLTCP